MGVATAAAAGTCQASQAHPAQGLTVVPPAGVSESSPSPARLIVTTTAAQSCYMMTKFTSGGQAYVPCSVKSDTDRCLDIAQREHAAGS